MMIRSLEILLKGADSIYFESRFMYDIVLTLIHDKWS